MFLAFQNPEKHILCEVEQDVRFGAIWTFFWNDPLPWPDLFLGLHYCWSWCWQRSKGWGYPWQKMMITVQHYVQYVSMSTVLIAVCIVCMLSMFFRGWTSFGLYWYCNAVFILNGTGVCCRYGIGMICCLVPDDYGKAVSILPIWYQSHYLLWGYSFYPLPPFCSN